MNGGETRFRNVVWLLVAQTLGAFNDNVAKAMLPALAALVIGKAEMDPVNQQVSLMLILPFVLFGPFAGWLSDRFSKRKVTSIALFAQVLGLAVLCVGMGMELFYLSLAGFFLLATQSAMLSPAKKGILKELVGSEKLGMAVGWMEMLTMVGILAGAFAGARGFDVLVENEGGWRAGLWISASVGVLAVISWIIFQPTPEVEPRSKKPFRLSVLFSHFHDLAELWKVKPLRLAALGDAWFWAFGTFFYLVLVKLSGEIVEGDVGMATLYGLWFLLLGVGIMIGSLAAAYVNRGRVELGLVPIGAVLMPIILYVLTTVDPLGDSFKVCCTALGMAGAFFFVPLNAFLQDNAGEERRGRVVAASNLLTNLLVIGLIGFHAYLSNTLKVSALEELLIMVIPCVLLAIYIVALLPQALFRTVTLIVARFIYRVRVSGAKNLPHEGGVLLLCNHVSYADPVLVGANVPREIQMIAFSGLTESRFMRLVFWLTSTIPVSPTRAKDAIVKASDRLQEGDAICIFPEGGISRLGPLLSFKKGFELIARKGGVPVVPAYLDGVWGSIFSFSGGKFFRKIPNKLPYPVRLRVGEPIPAGEAKAEHVRKVIQRLSREAFSERAEIHHSLAEALRTALRRGTGKPLVLTDGETKWTR
ncbi:MAG: MFS transporter, partial [Opitutales bacterium]